MEQFRRVLNPVQVARFFVYAAAPTHRPHAPRARTAHTMDTRLGITALHTRLRSASHSLMPPLAQPHARRASPRAAG